MTDSLFFGCLETDYDNKLAIKYANPSLNTLQYLSVNN